MGDENSLGFACVETVAVVANNQIPLVLVQLMVQPLVLIADGTNDFGDLQQNLWDEQCAFAGVADAIAFQGYYLECWEFLCKQCRYLTLCGKADFPSQFNQVTDQGDATGSMPQPPVQWGNQCGRSCLMISRNE